MKYFFTIIIIFLSIHNCYSQHGTFRPFSMVIINPDTVIIDSSLLTYIDVIYENHLKSYYSTIKQMEELLAFNDYPDNMKEQFEETKAQTKIELENIIKKEETVKQFIYYYIISEYSKTVFQYYFNEYPPFSTFQIVKSIPIQIKTLKAISDSLNVDYVVGYKNIYTMIENGRINLKLTTVLYARQENSILFEKESLGNANSYGGKWTCNNPLQCLLINGVKTSTENICKILIERQKK